MRGEVRDTRTSALAFPASAEERLKELGRRIDLLDASMQAAQPRLGIERRVAALRKGEASARAAMRDAAASIEGTMLHLGTRVNLAEHSAAADTAEDIVTFVAAITEELRSWDLYLERLQVKAATAAGSGRDQAEETISELRRYRNAFRRHVVQAASPSGEGWREVREHVQAARDELDARSAEMEARLR